jgi:hypothetical protein
MTEHGDHLSPLRERMRAAQDAQQRREQAERLLLATMRELTGLPLALHGGHGLYLSFAQAREWLSVRAGRAVRDVTEGVTEGVTE